MSFVRKSKFRHVFAQEPKSVKCWTGINFTNQAWHNPLADANPKFLAVAWKVGGGGAVGILDAKNPARLSAADVKLFTGHKGAVLDVKFSPFNDHLLATASFDATVKIWNIPSGGLTENVDNEVQLLQGHKKKVGSVSWNPVADNVIATSAVDYTVKLWDVRNGTAVNNVDGFTNIITSCVWNWNGSVLATACKDKKLRIVDPRAGSIVDEVDRSDIQGTKGNMLTFMGRQDKVFSVGFGNGRRQFCVYDLRNLSEVQNMTRLDSSSGFINPYYDADTDIVYLVGKGDCNIKYYEYDDGDFHNIAATQTATPAAGSAFMPKRGCDVNRNEVARLFKITSDTVTPLSYEVPRKADVFADDIFVPTLGDEPALDADAWFGGENADPKLISLEDGYVEKEAPEEVVFDKAEEEKIPDDVSTLQAAYTEMKNRIAYLERELSAAKTKLADAGIN